MDQASDDKATVSARERRNVSRRTSRHRYEVLVSFDGLNLGEQFPMDAEDQGWAQQHVDSGYLRDLGEVADERGQEGQG
jgi:hypothetical protein